MPTLCRRWLVSLGRIRPRYARLHGHRLRRVAPCAFSYAVTISHVRADGSENAFGERRDACHHRLVTHVGFVLFGGFLGFEDQ